MTNTHVRSHPYDGLDCRTFVLVQTLGTGRKVRIFEQGTAFPARTAHGMIVGLLPGSFHGPVTPVTRPKNYKLCRVCPL